MSAVYQSSFTKRFGHVIGWHAEPRQGEIVGSGSGDAQRLYQFQGERWVMVWGEATGPDPTDIGSPWPAPVPAIDVPARTWLPDDPAGAMWLQRLGVAEGGTPA